ncbi:MAG TPA: AraC family transcriptional regulator [Candidatus Binatia bacterium]|jgi:AraC-like DNA-binding protein
MDTRQRKEPLISLAVSVTPPGLLDFIAAAGADPDKILASVRLDRQTFSDREGFIPVAVHAEILEKAAKSTGDACFGLHWGVTRDPRFFGPLAYVLLNSPTIGAAAENAGRYAKVRNQASDWSCTHEGNRSFIRQSLQGVGSDWRRLCRQSSDCFMAEALNILRMMVGSRWAPFEVQFAHDPPSRDSEYIRVFGAPASFGHETNAFVVDSEFLKRDVPAADPYLYPTLKRYLDQVLEEVPPENGFLASVRKAVADSMRNGDCKLAAVAKRLGMTVRTFQRALKEHHTEFQALLDDTRYRFAQNYLREPQHTLTEVAFLLGYSEVSAFNRAFKRWTGSTPMEYRRNSSHIKNSRTVVPVAANPRRRDSR